MDILLRILPSVIVIIGGILAFWKTWGSVNERINGVGLRVNMLETDEAADREALSELKQFKQKSIDTHSYLQERIGKLETSVSNTDTLLNNMKFEILNKIGELQQTISSNNGKIRERIVRLEVVTELENKIGRNLNELMGSVE